MCKVGDIIVVKEYKHGDKILNRHSFIIIDDKQDNISGLDYDMVCNVMSSFKSNIQKERKLRISGNFPISHNDTDTNPNNEKDGFIKAEQFYFFNKSKLDYTVIGSINEESLKRLFDFIENLNVPINLITDNL